MLVQAADLSFGYPGTEIFSRLTLQINPGDHVGLVGPNGCGKSTLLRLMDGRLVPDAGQIVRARGIKLGYLQQSQEFDGGGRVLDALLHPFAELVTIRDEIATIEAQMHAVHDERTVERYGDLQERYGRAGGYTLEARLKALAHDLGFSDADLERTVESLSGGERGRLELAKTLLSEPDLLLLDEPTNHLDVAATEHLEERLSEWPRAFLLVSHDRYFLRAVCKEIIELENGQSVRFTGGYDKYVVEREARHEQLNRAFDKQQADIARTEDFIRRNLAGQKTKQAKSRRTQLEKVERLRRVDDEFAKAGQIGLRFSVGERPGGKDALVAVGLSAGYPDATLVRDLEYTVYRGDRIGIVGDNGAGKSTLLKTLLGRLPALAGQVVRGHEVDIGYFDQKLSDLDEERSLLEEIRTIRGDFNEDVARAFLGRFRFSGDDAFRKVKGLSGGERNRLTLAKMMLKPRNLLALDEPTNHLDIPGREVLEEALAAYAGTVLVISHDRYFLDRVVTKILHLHDGTWSEHPGNYSDWRARVRHKEPAAPPPPKVVASIVDAQPDARQNRLAERDRKKADERDRERKQKRLSELESKIANAESELARLNAQLAEAHGGDWQRLHGMVADRDKEASRLQSFMSEWEKLGAELEAAG